MGHLDRVKRKVHFLFNPSLWSPLKGAFKYYMSMVGGLKILVKHSCVILERPLILNILAENLDIL